MSRRTSVIVLLSLGAVFAAVGLYAARPASGQMGAGNMPKMLTLVIEGNFRVHFDCAFIDKGKAKETVKEQVKKIEFHPEYIVLYGQTGDGRVIPVHAIKELTWEQS